MMIKNCNRREYRPTSTLRCAGHVACTAFCPSSVYMLESRLLFPGRGEAGITFSRHPFDPGISNYTTPPPDLYPLEYKLPISCLPVANPHGPLRLRGIQWAD